MGIIKSIALIFLYIGVFFIPFNSYTGPDVLGEYKKHACTYFFLISAVLTAVDVINKKRLYFPYRNILFQLLILIIIWFCLATVFNIHNIINYNFKGTNGIVRFIKQFGSLIISAVFIFYTCLNLFNRQNISQVFFTLRKVTLWSFIIVIIYGVLEILILVFGIYTLMPLLNLFNYFPFTEVYLDNLKRISSVSYESPELGTYLICITGWMLSYIITEKKVWKYIPAAFVLILTYFSDSRSAIAVVLIQFLIFGILLFSQKKFRPILNKILLASILPLSILFVFKGKTITEYLYYKVTSFSTSDNVHATSNKSRLGIQYANYLVFKEHPISGVGFGQSAFESKKHYPSWATHNNWEFSVKYLNPNHKPFPPVYNMYVRFLSESGVIGFILFLTFIYFVLIISYKLYKNKYSQPKQLMGIVLLITFIGVAINWFKADTFRNFGFWVNLAFLVYLTGNHFKLKTKQKDKQLENL